MLKNIGLNLKMYIEHDYLDVLSCLSLEESFDCLKKSHTSVSGSEWFEQFKDAEISALRIVKKHGFVVMCVHSMEGESKYVVVNTCYGLYSVEHPSCEISPFSFEGRFQDPEIISVALFYPSPIAHRRCFFSGKWSNANFSTSIE